MINGILKKQLLSSNTSFSPTSVQGTLTHWYDATDESTITKNGSNQITGWSNKGSGGDFSKTANALTTHGVNQTNNKDTVNFNGEGNPFELTSESVSAPCSIFIVLDNFDGTDLDALFELQNSALDYRFAALGTLIGGENTNLEYDSEIPTGPTVIRVDKPDADGAQVYINGLQVLDSNNNLYPSTTYNILTIADDATGGNALNADMMHVIIIENPTASDIENLQVFCEREAGI